MTNKSSGPIFISILWYRKRKSSHQVPRLGNNKSTTNDSALRLEDVIITHDRGPN